LGTKGAAQFTAVEIKTGERRGVCVPTAGEIADVKRTRLGNGGGTHKKIIYLGEKKGPDAEGKGDKTGKTLH